MEKEYEIDELDRQIIKILSMDSKTNYREISKRLGTSLGTVHNRINNLKNRNIIKKFIIDIDTHKLGYKITAIILMQIDGKYIEQVEKKLSKESNIYGIYDTTGEWDCIIIVKLKKMEELNEFLKKINKMDHITRTITSVCLNVIKENSFLPT